MAMTGQMIDGVWTVDRSTWAPGPWDDEPDRIEWRTQTGLPGLIVRNGLGGLCGYVAVPSGHPAYGSHYDKVDVNVHGGLTYARRCEPGGPVCHVPEPGEPDDVFWLGFDCVHLGDAYPSLTKPGILPETLANLTYQGGTYRDVAYVRAEVESLAEQLASMVWKP